LSAGVIERLRSVHDKVGARATVCQTVALVCCSAVQINTKFPQLPAATRSYPHSISASFRLRSHLSESGCEWVTDSWSGKMWRSAKRALLLMAEARLDRALAPMDAAKAADLPIDQDRYDRLNREWEEACDARLDVDDEIAALA
jgi:hypothetical protein